MRALEEIGEEIATDEFAWHDELEDVHTHVEVRLREKIGAVADALHAGRSRNDQVAADLRLYVQDRTREALAAILELQTVAARTGRRNTRMPSCRATPTCSRPSRFSIAQPLLAYAAMLGRDWERFRDSLARVDRSPLGSGALAGSTFPLDRDVSGRAGGVRRR